MKKKLSFVIALLAFVLFLGASYFGYGALTQGASAGVMRARVSAPDFTVKDASGGDVKLSDMKGRPVVINFWASWCPPCRDEMPHFEEAYNELGADVHFMMVNLPGGSETRQRADQFIASQGLTFPVYYDVTGEAATRYEVQFIPTTIFVDSGGHLAGTSTGMLNKRDLMEGIKLAME